MPKIAILQDCWNYNDYSNQDWIIEKLTDFVEVSDEDYDILVKASYQGNFKVIKVPTDLSKFITETVADYLEKAKKEAAKRVKEAADRKALAEERKRKAAEKVMAKELKQLEQLKAKYGPV